MPTPDVSGGGLHGILLIDKSRGWTSHDVVAKARGITRQRKIGHTGTLDPMATGLLVLCLGDATRLVEYMSAHDKRYEGEITLGVSTDTDDAEGRTIATEAVPEVTDSDRAALVARFTGRLLQRPPAYSAISVGGQRAYAAARAGTELKLAERPVDVHSLELTLLDAHRLRILLGCGPGTYVRSIARDIGAALGCGGHLSSLRRTSVGSFNVASALSIEELARQATAGEVATLLLPGDAGIASMDAAILGPANTESFGHGNSLEVATSTSDRRPLRVYSTDGAFCGIGEMVAQGRLKPAKVLTNRA